jgi:hypothetical protein
MDAAVNGNEMYRRLMSREDMDDLSRKVWEPTPWMTDAFVGHDRDPRRQQMIFWCVDQFGEESSPIHEQSGTWHQGGAIVFGWQWFGFATEEELRAFEAAWPIPTGIERPAP